MYGASEGLTTMPRAGSSRRQAGTTSVIRNYLGFSRGISGRELGSRAVEQAMLMGAEIVFIRSGVTSGCTAGTCW